MAVMPTHTQLTAAMPLGTTLAAALSGPAPAWLARSVVAALQAAPLILSWAVARRLGRAS